MINDLERELSLLKQYGFKLGEEIGKKRINKETKEDISEIKQQVAEVLRRVVALNKYFGNPYTTKEIELLMVKSSIRGCSLTVMKIDPNIDKELFERSNERILKELEGDIDNWVDLIDNTDIPPYSNQSLN